MKTLGYSIGFVALLALSFAAGSWWTHRVQSVAAPRQAQAYACPMHPQYRSDRPGDCPSCGMRLEPVGGTASNAAAGDRPAGSVQVSVERQQAIGVRLGTAERVSGRRTLRTTGRVAANENAVYPLVAGADGWVREVRGATAGSLVRKDEVLATVYAPDLIPLQQSFYASLETADRVKTQQVQTATPVSAGVDRYADGLRNLGVSDKQLDDMRTKRQLVQNIEVVAPVAGFVLRRDVALGQRFERGFEFYRIADLRKVWVLADLYESQAAFVKPGSSARITVAQQSQAFAGKAAATEPVFDEATRTLKVRLETDNPGFALKPGMFVDVEFDVELPAALVVPADAIVDTGLRKTLFVDRGNGFFEPRQVETGWRLSDQVEIVKGLMPGERIVISGTFLIDSESRMKSAAQGVFGVPATDPVCGMEVDQKKAAAAGRKSDYKGTTYYFCADECKKKFEAEPAKYLAAGHDHAPAAPAMKGQTAAMPSMGKTAAVAVKDLVCGMDVDPKEAAAAGLKSDYKGKTYYFCAKDCKTKFDAEPGRWVK